MSKIPSTVRAAQEQLGHYRPGGSAPGKIMEQILLEGVLRHMRDEQVSKTAKRASPKADHT